MSVFKNTVAENVAAIRDWHQKHHHATTWADCVHEPCNVTNPGFRKMWS